MLNLPRAMRRILFCTIATLVVFINLSPVLALFCGVFTTVLIGANDWSRQNAFIKFQLGLCVIGLAAGIKTDAISQLAGKSLMLVFAAIILSFTFGYLFARLFRVPQKIACLLSVGTAICGGSAIVAVAPIVEADSEDLAVAIAIVFLLNALAMILFPFIGQSFAMSEFDFGLWSAIAIHDTASVIGTTLAYGQEAVAIATTAKLTRTLFLIPVVMIMASYMHKARHNLTGVKIPGFVKGFTVVVVLGWFFPGLWGAGDDIAAVAKRLIVLSLFLVGAGIKVETLKKTPLKPFAYSFVLWLSLSVIYFSIILICY